MVFCPMFLMLCSKERWNPLISAIIPITVPTPMTIPSSASSERSRFASSDRPAIFRVSDRNRFPIGLLVAQRFDRVEARGAERGVRAEEDPDQARHADAEEHRGHVD